MEGGLAFICMEGAGEALTFMTMMLEPALVVTMQDCVTSAVIATTDIVLIRKVIC